jgi:hypothetical protein
MLIRGATLSKKAVFWLRRADRRDTPSTNEEVCTRQNKLAQKVRISYQGRRFHDFSTTASI